MNDNNEALGAAVRGFADVATAAQLNQENLTAELKKRQPVARPMYLLALVVVGFTGLVDALARIIGGGQ